MKISKLFHWLYAVVMLLPIFAIGVTCGYAMFNKNAYESYSGVNESDITYEEKSISDLSINDKVFYTNSNQVLIQRNGQDLYITANDITLNNVTYNNANTIQFYAYPNSPNSNSLYLVIKEDNTTLISRNMLSNDLYELTFTFVDFNKNVVQSDYVSDILFYQVIYNGFGNIDNVFYYSVYKVTQSNMFSWAYDSFLVAPFSYIVALFSMPTNSPVVMLLSYWLTISIIWLVFDLVMYVPLLVHRWIDKGMLE